jgi:DNA integrity scanning protein DisA with diadenylate cyclase activity
MPHLISAMEDCIDIASYIREKIYYPLEIGLLLVQSQKVLNRDHTITHGFSLICYLRLLQLYFHQQLTAYGKPYPLNTTRWFVGSALEEYEVELFLSFDPELRRKPKHQKY